MLRPSEILFVLVIALASGFVSQYVASARGHDSTLFFWLGFFLPGVGLLVAFLSPPPRVETMARIPPAKAPSTLAGQLDELTRLHENGALTDGEFEAAKRRAIGESGASKTP